MLCKVTHCAGCDLASTRPTSSLVPRPSPAPVFESYHVIRSTGVTCRHAYMYSHVTEKADLGFCTSYEDETSTDGEQPFLHTASDQKLEPGKDWE